MRGNKNSSLDPAGLILTGVIVLTVFLTTITFLSATELEVPHSVLNIVFSVIQMTHFFTVLVGAFTIWAVSAALIGEGFSRVRDRGCDCSWVGPTDHAEIVETKRRWERGRDGAKIIWRHVERPLLRCTECGRHFHADEVEVVEEREAWPENEPEIMPDDEALLDAAWDATEVNADGE